MRPTSLALEGFGSYRQRTELDLSGVSVCAVSGANGAGKSTLGEAMIWALFGQVPDRAADAVICEGEQRAHVSFQFDLDGDEHTFERQRTASGRSRARYEGPLGSAEASKEVTRAAEEILRCNLQMLTMTAFARQKCVDAFTTLPSSERRQILSSVLLLGQFDAAEARAREHHENTQAEAQRIEGQLERARRSAAEKDAAVASLASAEQQAKDADEAASEIEAAAVDVDMSILKSAEDAAESVAAAERNLAEIGDIDALKSAAEAHRQEAEDQAWATAMASETHEQARQDARAAAETAAAADAQHTAARNAARAANADERLVQLREAQQRIQQGEAWLEGATEELCLWCGGVLDKDAIDKMIGTLTQLIDTRTEAEAASKHANTQAQASDDKARQAASHLQERQTSQRAAENKASQAEAAVVTAEQEKARLSERITALSPEAAKLPSLREALAGAPSTEEVQRARDARREAERQLGAARQKVQQCDEATAEAKSLEGASEQARRSAATAGHLRRAAMPAGVPHLALEQRLSAVVAASNAALAAFGGDMAVRLVTERASKQPPLTVDARRTGRGNGGWRPYATFSGGEQMRVDIALRVGLCRTLNLAARTIWLDEGWGTLDEQAAVALSTLLMGLVARGEADAVYSISHVRSAVEGFPSHIAVSYKQDKGSIAKIIA